MLDECYSREFFPSTCSFSFSKKKKRFFFQRRRFCFLLLCSSLYLFWSSFCFEFSVYVFPYLYERVSLYTIYLYVAYITKDKANLYNFYVLCRTLRVFCLLFLQIFFSFTRFSSMCGSFFLASSCSLHK